MTGSYLGVVVPIEANGSSSDVYQMDETYDDGVAFIGPWTEGPNGGNVQITAQCPNPQCYLAGWFDWNRDGDFNDLNENIISQSVFGGPALYTFEIPIGTDLQNSLIYYSRFRVYASTPDVVSPDGEATTSGAATVGEVEDYEITIARRYTDHHAGDPVLLQGTA